MAYDYDNAPTDPRHGGKLTSEMATRRIAELEEALRNVKHVLIVPAAEYVPAITDAWALIDAALGR